MNKDTSVIPKGLYCYNEKGNCPYWSALEHLPEQECGYCAFLEKSDWDLNEEYGKMVWRDKTGKITRVTEPHRIPNSLLWDQIKECGINEENEEEA